MPGLFLCTRIRPDSVGHSNSTLSDPVGADRLYKLTWQHARVFRVSVSVDTRDKPNGGHSPAGADRLVSSPSTVIPFILDT